MDSSENRVIQLQEKIKLAEDYKNLTTTYSGSDLFWWMNGQQAHHLNQFLRPQDERDGKASNDVLQGRLQMLSMISNYIGQKLVEGKNAADSLAKIL